MPTTPPAPRLPSPKCRAGFAPGRVDEHKNVPSVSESRKHPRASTQTPTRTARNVFGTKRSMVSQLGLLSNVEIRMLGTRLSAVLRNNIAERVQAVRRLIVCQICIAAARGINIGLPDNNPEHCPVSLHLSVSSGLHNFAFDWTKKTSKKWPMQNTLAYRIRATISAGYFRVAVKELNLSYQNPNTV